MKWRWPIVVRKTHKWLALLVGVQALLWSATGMYMVAVHIDHVRGNHLVRPEAAEPFRLDGLAAPGAIVAAHPGAREVKLQRLFGRTVWRVETREGAYLLDGASGARLPPLGEAEARARARQIYAGDDPIASVRLLREAPLEVQTRTPPFWQVEFDRWNRPTLYISPTTGELVSRRHAAWRVFDFAWMLHIMDYEGRTDVNNALLRVATVACTMLALGGALLLIWSFRWRRRRR